jgi:hypothetical protein
MGMDSGERSQGVMVALKVNERKKMNNRVEL